LNKNMVVSSGVLRGDERASKKEITKYKCCNKMIFPIVRPLTHAAWI